MDRLAAELERLGLPTTPQNLARDGRMGRMIRYGDAELSFGIEDDDETVVLTDYRRKDDREGLRTGFRSLLWFLGFIAERPHLRLRRLHGLIRPDRTPGNLTADRLAASYRILGGRLERTENGEDWMVVDFAEFRQRKKQFQRPAAEARPHA